mmetsp:Transcript_13583/g.27808  ORF Transcript_13583/g.27808 Transcript_13583/m.27808 type:complete len:105 (+) Transcript_13583:426-740(+)
MRNLPAPPSTIVTLVQSRAFLIINAAVSREEFLPSRTKPGQVKVHILLNQNPSQKDARSFKMPILAYPRSKTAGTHGMVKASMRAALNKASDITHHDTNTHGEE